MDVETTYSVTYSNGKGKGILITTNFDEAVRTIIRAARSGHIIDAKILKKGDV